MLMALLHRFPVPIRLATFVYRFLIGDEADLHRLEMEVAELEPQLARSTIQLKSTDEGDDLSWCADFYKEAVKNSDRLSISRYIKKKLSEII
jgi:hypothetical protein